MRRARVLAPHENQIHAMDAISHPSVERLVPLALHREKELAWPEPMCASDVEPAVFLRRVPCMKACSGRAQLDLCTRDRSSLLVTYDATNPGVFVACVTRDKESAYE